MTSKRRKESFLYIYRYILHLISLLYLGYVRSTYHLFWSVANLLVLSNRLLLRRRAPY
jgi:hypothetical protein